MPVNLREKQAYLSASPSQISVTATFLQNLLAALRAQYLSYQTSHWQQSGESAYGNHLLFQRLYEGLQDQIDELAEKICGLLGSEYVEMPSQLSLMSEMCSRWARVECHHRRGVSSEKDVQFLIQETYDKIKAAKAMTLGLDDWLMATANSHETNEYLLQQVLKSNPARVASLVNRRFGSAPSAEGDFYKNPQKEEVRQFAESKALSNELSVVSEAASTDMLDLSKRVELSRAEDSPNTPSETVRQPGGDSVSTLNRFVVDSSDPETAKAVKMNRSRMASWLREIEGS